METNSSLTAFSKESLTYEETPEVSNLRDNTDPLDSSTSHTKIAYISDLHLDHKMFNSNGEPLSDSTIKRKIREIVKSLYESINGADYLIFLGDISHELKTCVSFFKALKNKLSEDFDRPEIIFVLGNHELWGNGCRSTDVEGIVEEYKTALERYNVFVANNQLLVTTSYSFREYSREDIMSMSENDLKRVCINSKYLILCGTGFSGLNPVQNYSIGLYRNTIAGAETEAYQTDLFRSMYEKLCDIAKDKHLCVCTHMPIQDWMNGAPMPGWTYVNGHTHCNNVWFDNNSIVFSDNQVGYYGKDFRFKTFVAENNVHPLAELKDGIYRISRQDYIDFNRSLGIHMDFNSIGHIFLLRRSGYSMFMLREKDHLYTLEGGKKSEVYHPIQYYYDNMETYAKNVDRFFFKYNSGLKNISNAVRSFGGNGRIHGCIVDIDFWNHIYLNPMDGSLTYYYAIDVIQKKVYQNLPSLLKERCPELLDNYLKLIGDEENVVSKNIFSEQTVFYGSTDIYNISNQMRKFQYSTMSHIIRQWSPALAIPDAELSLEMNDNELFLNSESLGQQTWVQQNEEEIQDISQGVAVLLCDNKYSENTISTFDELYEDIAVSVISEILEMFSEGNDVLKYFPHSRKGEVEHFFKNYVWCPFEKDHAELLVSLTENYITSGNIEYVPVRILESLIVKNNKNDDFPTKNHNSIFFFYAEILQLIVTRSMNGHSTINFEKIIAAYQELLMAHNSTKEEYEENKSYVSDFIQLTIDYNKALVSKTMDFINCYPSLIDSDWYECRKDYEKYIDKWNKEIHIPRSLSKKDAEKIIGVINWCNPFIKCLLLKIPIGETLSEIKNKIKNSKVMTNGDLTQEEKRTILMKYSIMYVAKKCPSGLINYELSIRNRISEIIDITLCYKQ